MIVLFYLVCSFEASEADSSVRVRVGADAEHTPVKRLYGQRRRRHQWHLPSAAESPLWPIATRTYTQPTSLYGLLLTRVRIATAQISQAQFRLIVAIAVALIMPLKFRNDIC